MESAVSRRDGERIWNTGAGIIVRLRGCGPGSRVPPGVVARGGEWLGKGESAIY